MKIPWRGHENDFMAHELSKIDGHDLIWGHEMSMKKEDILFMTHESKSCLFHGPWIFHENDADGAHTMKLCNKTHAPCFSWFFKKPV